MEAPPSGVIRVMNSKQHNKKLQVKLPASRDAWKRDPNKNPPPSFEAGSARSRNAQGTNGPP